MTGIEEKQLDLFGESEAAPKEAVFLQEAVVPQEPVEEPAEPLNEYGYTESEWNATLFDGGPTRREIEEWKEKYGNVYFTPIADEIYIWRTLARDEYKVMIDDRSLTTMDREELMCEKVVLFPRNYTRTAMITGKAGTPSLLSEQIMDKSGFVAQSAPIKL